MTVSELLEKLKEYPADGVLDSSFHGGHDKIIVTVNGDRLDPVFQIKLSVSDIGKIGKPG